MITLIDDVVKFICILMYKKIQLDLRSINKWPVYKQICVNKLNLDDFQRQFSCDKGKGVSKFYRNLYNWHCKINRVNNFIQDFKTWN